MKKDLECEINYLGCKRKSVSFVMEIFIINMRKKHLLILSLLFISTCLFSQTDFRKAYIITNSNDTTYGFIDYRGDIKNCSKCIFRLDSLSKSITFLPNEIKAYRFIDSKYYVSSIIGDSLKKDTLFLEYLIDGIVDIYYYKSNKKEAYYIKKGNSEYVELTDNKYEESSSSLSIDAYAWNTNRYIGILKYFFSDSKNVLDKTKSVSLSHKSLINIAKDYHADVCENEECVVFEKRMPKINVDFGIIAGSKISSIDFEHFKYAFSHDIESNIFLGIELTVSLNSVSEKISLQFESLYNKNKFNSKYSLDTYIGSEYYSSYVDYSSIFNSLSIKYTYPKGKVRPILYLGGALDYILANESEILVENQYNERITESDDILFYPGKSAYAGIIVGTGMDFCISDKIIPFFRIDYSYLYLNGAISSIENIKFTLGIKI